MEINVRKMIEGVRRLHSKNWNKAHYNWWIVSEVLGKGMTTSVRVCRDNGVDPDGTDAPRSE